LNARGCAPKCTRLLDQGESIRRIVEAILVTVYNYSWSMDGNPRHYSSLESGTREGADEGGLERASLSFISLIAIPLSFSFYLKSITKIYPG
jgi:hypothetical protein